MNQEGKTAESDIAGVGGIEALCDSATEMQRNKDLTLCYICMQWSCEGPHCHREDVCPPEQP